MKMHSTTFFVFLIISLSASNAQETTVTDILQAVFEKYKNENDHCLKESNVDEAKVNKLIKTGEIDEDRNLFCFIKCLSLKSGFMNNNGDIQVEDVKKRTKFLDGQILDTIAQKCPTKKEDLCEAAIDILKCSVGVLTVALKQK